MWKQTTRMRVRPRPRSVRFWLTGGLLLLFVVLTGLLLLGGTLLGRDRDR